MSLARRTTATAPHTSSKRRGCGSVQPRHTRHAPVNLLFVKGGGREQHQQLPHELAHQGQVLVETVGGGYTRRHTTSERTEWGHRREGVQPKLHSHRSDAAHTQSHGEGEGAAGKHNHNRTGDSQCRPTLAGWCQRTPARTPNSPLSPETCESAQEYIQEQPPPPRRKEGRNRRGHISR